MSGRRSGERIRLYRSFWRQGSPSSLNEAIDAVPAGWEVVSHAWVPPNNATGCGWSILATTLTNPPPSHDSEAGGRGDE